jgi:hypothetical protein
MTEYQILFFIFMAGLLIFAVGWIFTAWKLRNEINRANKWMDAANKWQQIANSWQEQCDRWDKASGDLMQVSNKWREMAMRKPDSSDARNPHPDSSSCPPPPHS